MKQSEFKQRRERLMQRLGRGNIAIVAGNSLRQRNRDNEYPFRQNSDFYYLTGFIEPDALAVLAPDQEHPFILFCRERNPERERWEGPQQGLEGARKVFGADLALAIGQRDEQLPLLIAQAEIVHYSFGSDPELDSLLPRWIGQQRLRNRTGSTAPRALIALDHLLHEMRLIKSTAEIDLMRKSAAIASKGHQRLMQITKPGMLEYALEAEFYQTCALEGAREPAYPAIVGSGRNACVLHYRDNASSLLDGDLVLIDAGCEYGYYASDITRTLPVNGRFNPHQRQLYQLVLDAQEAAIAQVQPGNSWDAPHQAAIQVLTRGLVKLGLLKGSFSRQIKRKGYERFYMHKTGHWLGMDVHDVGYYKIDGAWRNLEAGMVLTVEPGLYIAADDTKVAKEWRGIGIRIEDDVLVTDTGCEVLSRGAVKTIGAIEALMAS